MKETQRLINGLVACGVAIAMVSTLAAQTSDQVTAKVIRIKGTARYSTTGTSEWKPLKSGAELAPGTLVQTDTDKDTCVDLVVGDVANANEVMATSFGSSSSSSTAAAAPAHETKATQNLIHLSANTLLSIDKMIASQTGGDTTSETELDLRTGSITGRVKKISAGSRFEIKVPNGVAAIRGTDFLIATIDLSRGGSNTRGVLGVQVWVSSGSVVLSWTVAGNPNPITQVIRPGQGCSTITGIVEQLTPAQAGQLADAIQQAVAALTPSNPQGGNGPIHTGGNPPPPQPISPR
jgi:hypothetical protein